jgi:predicted GH43/DUF377 family glycosyl hydrolase
MPNVVYSCGSLMHGRKFILPFAVSDQASAIASFQVDELLAALLSETSQPTPEPETIPVQTR